MDVPYEWEENKTIDPAVYQEMAQAGLLTALAFGHRVPKKWAKKDGTVFAGVKAEDWDGLCVQLRVSSSAERANLSLAATT